MILATATNNTNSEGNDSSALARAGARFSVAERIRGAMDLHYLSERGQSL